MPENDIYIAGIGQGVLELLSFNLIQAGRGGGGGRAQ